MVLGDCAGRSYVEVVTSPGVGCRKDFLTRASRQASMRAESDNRAMVIGEERLLLALTLVLAGQPAVVLPSIGRPQ